MLANIREILFFDTVPRQSKRATDEVTRLLEREHVINGRRVQIRAVQGPEPIYDCDAIVTATYGNSPVINSQLHVLRPGTFIAAVGADLEGKRELEHNVYDDSKFIVDDMRQSLWEGELQHAISKLDISEAKAQWANRPPNTRHKGSLLGGRIMSVSDFLDDHAPFLRQTDPITVYDSTGFSGQDLALARVMLAMLEKAKWTPRPWNPPKDVSLVDLLEQESPT